MSLRQCETLSAASTASAVVGIVGLIRVAPAWLSATSGGWAAGADGVTLYRLSGARHILTRSCLKPRACRASSVCSVGFCPACANDPLSPTFHPLFKTRPGGRMLESLYGKPLPRSASRGRSAIAQMHHRGTGRPGTSLRRVRQHGHAILGSAKAAAGLRFPLLSLDARATLSAGAARQVARSRRRAEDGDRGTSPTRRREREPFVGLRPGVTREVFGRSVARSPTVFTALGRAVTRRPASGRVHAIGAGLVILEIPAELGHDLPRLRLESPRFSTASRGSCTCRSRLHFLRRRASAGTSGRRRRREYDGQGITVRHGLFNADLWHGASNVGAQAGRASAQGRGCRHRAGAGIRRRCDTGDGGGPVLVHSRCDDRCDGSPHWHDGSAGRSRYLDISFLLPSSAV